MKKTLFLFAMLLVPSVIIANAGTEYNNYVEEQMEDVLQLEHNIMMLRKNNRLLQTHTLRNLKKFSTAIKKSTPSTLSRVISFIMQTVIFVASFVFLGGLLWWTFDRKGFTKKVHEWSKITQTKTIKDCIQEGDFKGILNMKIGKVDNVTNKEGMLDRLNSIRKDNSISLASHNRILACCVSVWRFYGTPHANKVMDALTKSLKTPQETGGFRNYMRRLYGKSGEKMSATFTSYSKAMSILEDIDAEFKDLKKNQKAHDLVKETLLDITNNKNASLGDINNILNNKFSQESRNYSKKYIELFNDIIKYAMKKFIAEGSSSNSRYEPQHYDESEEPYDMHKMESVGSGSHISHPHHRGNKNKRRSSRDSSNSKRRSGSGNTSSLFIDHN